MENVADYAIFFLDAGGSVTGWNAGAERILGYSEAEALGQPVAFIFTPEDRANRAPEREMAEAVAEGRAEDERWHVKKGGGRFWASGVLTALRDDAGALCGFAKILRDVTERRSLEGENTRHLRDLRFVAAHARCLLWHGTVRDYGWGQGGYHWETEVFDEEVAQQFLPLDVLPGERYTSAWYRHRLPEGKALTDRVSHEALQAGRDHYGAEFGCEGRDGAVRWFQEEVYVEPVPPAEVASRAARTGQEEEDEYTEWRVVGVVCDVTERREAEEALRASYARDRHIAETLQQSLLLAPSVDSLKGLQVQPFYRPALAEANVGGDFFDAFPLDGGRVALVVGDASGKGLPAAVRTVEVKFAVRAFLTEYPYPARTLARVNSFLYHLQNRGGRPEEREGFVALTLAVVDPVNGEVVLAVAGTEPPLLVRGTGCEPTPVDVGGPPLGVAPGAEYEVTSVRLGPGDTLLLTTDGLTEARRGGTEFLGYEGLTRLARAACTLPSLEAMGQAILDGAREFAGGQFPDDVCLLLARLR
jgi:PAS domain S-box-containing protein